MVVFQWYVCQQLLSSMSKGELDLRASAIEGDVAQWRGMGKCRVSLPGQRDCPTPCISKGWPAQPADPWLFRETECARRLVPPMFKSQQHAAAFLGLWRSQSARLVRC